MVNYGATLLAAADASRFPAGAFMAYEKLKKIIEALEEMYAAGDAAGDALGYVPLAKGKGAPASSPRAAPSSFQVSSHEAFLEALDLELAKMDAFAHREVAKVKRELDELEGLADRDGHAEGAGAFAWRVDSCGEHFLDVEKYVNVNVTAVRKMLKKHDKVLPQRPIAAFYTARLHDMRWIQTDYSSVLVRLSRLYESKAEQPEATDWGGVTAFVRATTKYWVRSEDLSAVKLEIGKHLPVLLCGGKGDGVMPDSQLVNSVYLDSPALELYHGRLSKTPGAVALRFRWYGTGEPELVFVERKTHRDSWTGDGSVKERFVVTPDEVLPLIRGEFDPRAPRAKPYAPHELQLCDEIQGLIARKQLVPTIRSQCHRVAYQLGYSNAVRCSIDTNLTLVNEIQKAEFDPLDDHGRQEPRLLRWYRDATRDIPRNEITRFPFAVLELKLALAEGEDQPEWTRPLVSSLELAPVNKFSKFIHACATLLPDEVQAFPYWIDDPALRASIAATNPSVLKPEDQVGYRDEGRIENWNNPSQQWAAPELLERTRLVPSSSDTCFGRDVDVRAGMQKPLVRQKIEPKLIFATERTVVHWLHVGAVLTAFGAGCFAVANGDAEAFSPGVRTKFTAAAFALSIGAAGVNAFAIANNRWRLRRMRSREPTEWGDPRGPIVVGGLMIAVFAAALLVNLKRFAAGEI
mmetsp:Transcript_25168/g.78529  ORF Transcript_25168/g.78529 Transcript_25168/m.78529 type:complete len:691 (+) Transcript_25168:637-2709(+)